MPIGAIYVQYPYQQAPHELWPGTWTNVTSSYANCFFRAEGDLSKAFNSGCQESGLPNLYGQMGKNSSLSPTFSCFTNGVFSHTQEWIASAGTNRWGQSVLHTLTFNAAGSNAIYGAASEVRPYNHAIRIWKRTE